LAAANGSRLRDVFALQKSWRLLAAAAGEGIFYFVKIIGGC